VEIFLVGGAIRDEMLGLEVLEKDWVVVGAKPQDLKALSFKQVGKSFPVFLHPETKEEYALARTERKVSRGYHGFEFDFSPDVTLEEDLGRRDLTINAIAKNEAGDFIDPYNGIEDIRARVLRHVSGAFAEDPVRVLRLARFAAKLEHLGFQLAPETQELVWQMVKSGELEHLVPERVWKETEKALKEKGPVAFLKILRQTKALSVIYPEIDALYGVPQSKKMHPEVDTGIHVELVLWQAARLSGLPEVRFAALVHDLGKAVTPKSELPKHAGHGEKGLPILKALCERLKVPTKYKELAELVMRKHIQCHQMADKSAQDILNFIEESDAFRRPERFRQMLMVCEADSRGRLGFEHVDYEPRSLLEEAFYAVDFINAKDVLKDLSIDADEIKKALFNARLAEVEKVKQRREIKRSST
tara:strand:+ start:19177 stop:20424 length:1248 start_codon:yes stop_codon:yes gene_type:complete